MNWSTILEGLTKGTHVLQVAVSCKSYYASPTGGEHLYYRTYGDYFDIINFTVIYPHQISILSLENKTYKTNNVQLNSQLMRQFLFKQLLSSDPLYINAYLDN